MKNDNVPLPIEQALKLEDYRIEDQDVLLTPALLIYQEIVDGNVEATLRMLGGNPNRWRPHVKTAKLEFTMRRLVQRGIAHFKCATTLELLTAYRSGASDVLLAYPVQGANAERVRQIAIQCPSMIVSVLVETPSGLERWGSSPVGIFIDINPGMNRTGVDPGQVTAIVELARAIVKAGLKFRGLHYYDGHLGSLPLEERTRQAHRGYQQLLNVVAAVERDGIRVEEVITSGTPAFPCALSFPGFEGGGFLHRVSPGTIVYTDLISLEQLPPGSGYRPAAIVLSRIVSHPSSSRITCDAGHKALAIDCGVPNCAVLGHPTLRPRAPSEEHLPIEVPAGEPQPSIGDFLYLIPRHVCPTVNNFNEAIVVDSNRVIQVEPVSARGREPAFTGSR